MAKPSNKIQLIGNVGQDLKIKELENSKVLNFSLATNKKTNDGGTKTTWHNIVVWNKLAEIIAQYVKKGDKILVVGELIYNEYEKSGVKISRAEILVSDFEFCNNNKN